MQKKLRKSGSSYSLTFTKTMLELLDMDPTKDEVELIFGKKKLIVSKAKPENTNSET